MRLSVLIYGAAVLLAALLGALANRHVQAEVIPSLFALPASTERGIASLALGAFLAALVVEGGRLLERREWYRRMAEALAELVRALLGSRPALADFALVALSSALGEESLFRGFVQPGLCYLVARLGVAPSVALPLAVVAGAAVFAAFHVAPPFHRSHSALRVWTLFAFLIGLGFGGLAAWSGSLAAPVLAHFLINFINLRRLFALPRRPVAPPPPGC